ncbi:hypothetical protein [Candidatus Viadribacter manganicus]|uniref:Uncharacterized protein n=1 Tax=Candidatus Viadribacter manganicus TaxID=1759059 RepID=A0A1B1ALV9_9PROT|nr:hypothetical protein [Candidatus Viadribacter manganicus]ANP47546.1 hypothetical protein ATE48_17370 [Candidatus Viadribacter manganicus]
MTKDGRPSRIADIRHFFGDLHTYLKGHEEAVAFGRRIAWFLNGEGFSLGAYPALYLYFTSAIPSGATQVTDYGGDWWQRYTHVGVPPNFPEVPDANEVIVKGTVEALLAIRPDQSDLIKKAEQIVRTNGAELRFLLKRHETKKRTVEVAFSIAAWPQPSHLHVSITDKTIGAYSEAAPVPLRFYDEAFDLAGSVKVSDAATTVEPNDSFRAKLASAEHGGPLSFELTAFTPSPRPVSSNAVKRRG